MNRPGDDDPTPGRLLEQAFADHAGVCMLYARQVAASPADAEDAVQEAFIRLMRQLQEGRPPQSARAWLLQATRSAALDLRRRQQRRRDREARLPAERWFTADPGAALDASEAAQSLARLPQRQREVVTLRIWGGLGFTAIADMVGIATSTAHADFNAAMETLRNRLRPGHDERKHLTTRSK